MRMETNKTKNEEELEENTKSKATKTELEMSEK